MHLKRFCHYEVRKEAGSCQEGNPVLCHLATTTRQPQSSQSSICDEMLDVKSQAADLH